MSLLGAALEIALYAVFEVALWDTFSDRSSSSFPLDRPERPKDWKRFKQRLNSSKYDRTRQTPDVHDASGEMQE
ncbi:MAG: hypothetical protein HYV27_12225 [Candidatus Hydrogenedentes bacterium]|nr:hypothetical protein [Candidatus Hydrogenedentota bacterium]